MWVEPSAKFEKDGDPSTLKGFFGTDSVMLTYVDENQNIQVVDYVNGTKDKPKTFKLKKPSNRKNWKIDSPLILPLNAQYVVYNMNENSTTWEAYVQFIDENSEPIKIERTKDMMSEPAQPHWFEYYGRLFVLWAEFPLGSQMLNKNDLADVSAQNGSVGRTVMREIRLIAGAPADFAVEWVGENRVIATVPMTGGRSSDGKFLATGTNKAYLLKLP